MVLNISCTRANCSPTLVIFRSLDPIHRRFLRSLAIPKMARRIVPRRCGPTARDILQGSQVALLTMAASIVETPNARTRSSRKVHRLGAISLTSKPTLSTTRTSPTGGSHLLNGKSSSKTFVGPASTFTGEKISLHQLGKRCSSRQIYPGRFSSSRPAPFRQGR